MIIAVDQLYLSFNRFDIKLLSVNSMQYILADNTTLLAVTRNSMVAMTMEELPKKCNIKVTDKKASIFKTKKYRNLNVCR